GPWAYDHLRFDRSAGWVIVEPLARGSGFWVGAHKFAHDPESGLFTLFYRLRTPLERGRGGVCRVATSDDGIRFDDVWEATKEDLAASSIEVGHCLRHDAGEWRLYLSYERAGSPGYWRIDVATGPSPAELDTQGRRTVLDPTNFGLGFIKDPVVYRTDDGGYRLYATTNPRTGPTIEGDRWTTAPQEETILAESRDGRYFETIEYVLAPAGDRSWHGQRARLNGLVDVDGGTLGTYDGSRTAYDNYEEWCGLVTTADGRSFERVPLDEPWVRSPHGSVRYVFPLRVGDRVYWYYEFTRADGSHDLRVSVVDL
ncbi:MAG: hypothetical protein AB1Z55_08420, partial [Acidimicrobiia bacterium]